MIDVLIPLIECKCDERFGKEVGEPRSVKADQKKAKVENSLKTRILEST